MTTTPVPARTNWLVIGGTLALAVALLVMGTMTLGGDLLFGSAETSNLLVVFLTGLTAGGLTCLAVQGGLLATAVTQREVYPPLPPSRGGAGGGASLPLLRAGAGGGSSGMTALRGKAAPIIMFLGAKLAAYTLLGALLGLFGQAVGITPTLQGWLQVAVGLFMLGVAAQMLDLHPVFRVFALTPPKSLQRLIRQESKRDSLFAPAALGAMTVFMPCATTQAIMIAAVGTGNPMMGALTMFAYTLGTTPLFFSLGYLATQLSGALRGAFSKVAAATITVLAVFSIVAGLALLGAPVPDLLVWASPKTEAVMAASAGGTIQEAVVRADPTAYVPNRIVFKTGTPAQLKLVTGDRLGCTSSFVIPSLGVQKALWKNEEAVFKIPTNKPGKIPFTCSMGMYWGVIEVEA